MEPTAVIVVAAGVVLFGLVSHKLRDSIVTPPLVFAVFGLVIGGAVLEVVDLDLDNALIHGLAEVTLILVLFSDAARIDLRMLRLDHNLPVRMLSIGMPLTIVLGAAVAMALFPGFGLWEAALLAAVLAPTDAALGQSVVSSAKVPVRMRQALNVESGLNDGIALPLVLLFASLASASGEGADAGFWIRFGLLQIILGPIAGVAVGWAGGRAVDGAIRRGWMSESFEGLSALALALIAFALAEVIGGNGFIAAFAAGLTLGNTVRGRCTFLFAFAEAEGQLLTLLTFLVFGAAMLPSLGIGVSGAMILFALLSLTVIRMVPTGLSLVGSGLRAPSVLFLGWFGPRGLASILFALLVVEEAAIGAREEILLITILTVAISIVAHGVTAAPAAGWYARLTSGMGECAENKPVSEMPARVKVR